MPYRAIRSLAVCAAWFVLPCCTVDARAANRPEYCAQISDDLLSGLAAPYASQVAPNGSTYCEGLLRLPISSPPPEVISVKQDDGDSSFSRGSIAALTWCDVAQSPVHVQLRSIKEPLFALDALQASKFEWRADLIAAWQPNWSQLAALASRQVSIEGQSQSVVIPMRVGIGYSSQYSFLLRTRALANFTTVLIEPADAVAKTEILSVVAQSGPAKNTWVVSVPFANRSKGIFRVTFEESIVQAGISTKPIYLLHGDCANK